MSYEPCPKRNKLTILDRDGSKQQLQQCSSDESPAFGTFVEPGVCAACPIRERLAKEAPKLPADRPSAYRTVSPASPDLCVDRKQIVTVKCCGTILRTVVCDQPNALMHGQKVSTADCKACSTRRPASDPQRRGLPGTELAGILKELNFQPTSACDCARKIRLMDEWGCEGCLKRKPEIVCWLKAAFGTVSWLEVFAAGRAAAKTEWFRLSAPFESLVDEAIRRAETSISTEGIKSIPT